MTDRAGGGAGWFREGLAGAGIGSLVGLLVGLSTAEVVGGVVAALTALLAAFFGLRASGSGGEGASSALVAGNSWRLAGFGLAGTLALVVGIWLRATNALGTDPATLMQQYREAGYDSVVAQGLVALELVGVAPEGWELARESMAGTRGSVLFGEDAASECSNLRESRYRDAPAWAGALQAAREPAWRALGESVASLDAADQAAVIRSAWSLVCEP